LNKTGNVTAVCNSGCGGARSMFEWMRQGNEIGAVTDSRDGGQAHWRLFRCGGCGAGALGTFRLPAGHAYNTAIASAQARLVDFSPEAPAAKVLPAGVPEGLVKEFREAERCLSGKCNRAAAGMARSVLDKTLRANGYKIKKGTPLEQQIDAAAADGVITAARRQRAHDEIRVLGNDVLHDEWREIAVEDVDAALHYTQRVLEDFYDDRASVLKLIRATGKKPHEDMTPDDEDQIK